MIDQLGFMPKTPLAGSAVAKPFGQGEGAAQITKQFGSFLDDAIHQLNQRQGEIDTLNEQFVTGELTDIHALTIATEKVSLGLELTVQIRNKAIEAYQEIMRTQI